jgi:hypothetical protein
MNHSMRSSAVRPAETAKKRHVLPAAENDQFQNTDDREILGGFIKKSVASNSRIPNSFADLLTI